MKFLIVLIFGSAIIGLACLRPPVSPENTRYVTVTEPEIFFEGKVETFDVKLHDVEGRCVLSSKNRSNKESEIRNTEVGMKSPCNFVRASWLNYAPLSYVYRQGKTNQVRVLIITGGPPSAEMSDEFQPDGCGTQIRKLLVYPDRIEMEEEQPHIPGLPICPAGGLDEVWFAA